MKYTVSYQPKITNKFKQAIIDKVSPSMTSDDSSLYNVDYIEETLPEYAIEFIALAGCEYIEI